MTELKRRKVVRVGIAYIAIAWVLLQVAEIVFQFLEFPAWAGKLLIVALSLGLPVSLFLAWVYQLTPKGIVRDEDVERTVDGRRQPGAGAQRIPELVDDLADQPGLLSTSAESPRTAYDERGSGNLKIFDELERLMVEEKLYREEDFTIKRLAREMNIKEYRLRRLINAHLGYRNFNQFLNQYRIAEVARLLVDPETRHLPVLSIALDMGYRSLSPFNKAFKEIKGMTPTEYRRRYGRELNDPR